MSREMTNQRLFLRRDIVLEPLIDHWYAWSHLVSPATAAMNIVQRHLRIMESFVRGPAVHAAAVRNPAMLGGPFVDLPASRVGDVRALIEWTKQRRANMIVLHDALVSLTEMLRREADGSSLVPLYPAVPDPLRGLVELVYDLDDNPSFRVIEPLLYASKWYDPSTQSLMVSRLEDDGRPFILSTPRFAGENDLHLHWNFAAPEVDALCRLRREPRELSEIAELLRLDGETLEKFRSFLTPEAPSPYRGYQGERARWRYFGHACLLIEARGLNVLVDPILSYPYETGQPRYTYRDLPDRIDYVLITHNHQDHLLLETLLQIRHRVDTVVVPRCSGGDLQDPSLKWMLSSIGFGDVRELGEMDTIALPDGEIRGLPFLGEHSDLNVRSKIMYRLQLGDRSLVIGVDACNVEPRLYELIADTVGPTDVLFLGMECEGAPLSWLYGPLITRPLERKKDRSRTLSGCDYEQAMGMINALRPTEVYVYAMGLEPWFSYILSKRYTDESKPIVDSNRVIAECLRQDKVSERLFGEREMFL